MHLDSDQYVATYHMNNNGELTVIYKVSEQKPLGVLIDNKLKFLPHSQAMVKKANRNLGIIKRTFSYICIWIKQCFLTFTKPLCDRN